MPLLMPLNTAPATDPPTELEYLPTPLRPATTLATGLTELEYLPTPLRLATALATGLTELESLPILLRLATALATVPMRLLVTVWATETAMPPRTASWCL